MFQGKKILLGVTGSIAAYKSLLLVRQFVKAGATVKVILTPCSPGIRNAFVSLYAVKASRPHRTVEENTWVNHVELGRWADLMLIAPLSCNTLAKMAGGLCDNLLLATYLSAVLSGSSSLRRWMRDMWKHPATRANIERLKAFGNRIIPVEKGELASGLNGEGRMAEPEAIFSFIGDSYFRRKGF